MKQTLLLIALFFGFSALAQKGTLTGVLTDKEQAGAPLPFANISVKGTTTGTATDENGKYTLPLDAGTYTIDFSFVGYESQTQQVTIVAGQTLTVDKALGSGSYTLKDVELQAVRNHEKETALLAEQKKAVEIKQTIGAQELSRKGVTDVANAVVKTTGVTKQGSSGTIFVRGLGDRYNGTTMNGLPIPSNDAEKKNIALEIFPTDIVEYVSIDKVYMTSLYGDFAGGNVDIVSKKQSGKGFLRLDVGSNINTNAVAEDNFRLGSVPNSFGFATTSQPANGLTQYNYRSWGMDTKNPFAGNYGISGGNSWTVGGEGKISLFATGSFANEFQSIKNGAANAGISGSGIINKRFDSFESFAYATGTTGMANLSYKINNSNKIDFNSVFINTSNQKTEEYRGYIVDIANDGNGLLRINTFTKTTLLINQILGEHKFGDRFKLNWAGAFNRVMDNQPDRTWNTLNQVDGGYVINNISQPNNNRYFQELTENEINAIATGEYKFNKDDEGAFKGTFRLGYNGRMKKRDFDAVQYNFKATATHLGDIVDPDRLDEFYNAANFANGYFTIATFRGGAQVPNAEVPQTYTGDLNVQAGFASVEYRLTPKLTTVVGLRGEVIAQEVKWNTALGNGDQKLDKTAILPNLIAKYELNDKQNLRLAFSKTYTLPQFKERAPFAYERGTQAYFGNKDLYESDDYNLDLKWEMFPTSDEVYALTVFGKYIQNPINEVVVNSSTNDISWVNSGDKGYAFGVEAEVRKNIWKLDGANDKKLSAGLNVSYLHTDQDLSDQKVSDETALNVNFTNKKDSFSGASDLLLNADLSYYFEWNEKKSNFNATLAYNLFSDRIYAIGTQQRGNIVEKSVGTLDFIVKSKITEKIGLSFTAKNLTDPRIRQVQENPNGDVLVETYKKGMMVGLGINYTF